MRNAQGKLKFRTWGGARKGTGRKPGPRPKVRHRARPKSKKGCPVLVTYRFARSDLRQDVVLTAVRDVLLALHERLDDFRVIDFSIQDDHLHLIVEADDAASFKSGYYALSIRLGKRVNAALGTSGRVFADRGHFRSLTTPREVRNARAYVLLNRRHHRAAKGRTLPTEIDRFSSGAWFDGWAAGVAPPREGPCAVAEPRTWLARTGWRRHGLLSPREIPGTRTGT